MEISSFNSAMQSTSINNLTGTNGINRQPPPPPPQDELSEFMGESGDSEEVKAFMESIMEMEASGEFDAATLAASAPASMQAFAEKNGVDLAEFLQQKHEQFQSMKSNTSQPPMRPAEAPADTYANTEKMGAASSQLSDQLTASIGINTQA
ncbi:hypothetical protein [Alteromonas confluentis]|uniref:Uncharacterized protein n=1 Tax=Alteromonas confluentis TaxID=1656094 RepID=A0A1E7ZBJ4_9ALTE|nr:hypothetical protein [Alteromonas confluentis]OFC70831.1 hypothetical protein BFC18_10265 [Alteromonas confluentis]